MVILDAQKRVAKPTLAAVPLLAELNTDNQVANETYEESAFANQLALSDTAQSVESALDRARHELRRATDAICRMSAVMPDCSMRTDLGIASATITLAMEAINSVPSVNNSGLAAYADEMLEALQAAMDCGLVPKSSVSDGGGAKYSRQVQVADMIRAVLAKVPAD